MRIIIGLFAAVFLHSMVVFAEEKPSAYWVFFKDKGRISSSDFVKAKKSLSSHSLLRRGNKVDTLDLPVYPPYIDTLKVMGVKIKNISKWLNAVSVYATPTAIKQIQSKPFVKSIQPLGTYKKKIPPEPIGKIQARKIPKTIYGNLYPSVNKISVPFIHDYIKAEKNEEPGKGVCIAVFDAGFEITHPCFRRMLDSNALVADSDFVSHDGNVGWQTDEPPDLADHGNGTLSLLAGYNPDTLLGVAYAAQYILARTENGDDTIEIHQEEDNWAAAMEWAEAIGADIISSSVGYRYDFTFPDTDYTASDMNGQTAIISIAAALGVSRGLIIVNANGNEGPSSTTLDAPADVDGVISVGAVDDNGSIASFSSRGPTADGRIKPDVVAPGVTVFRANGYGGYTYGSGTSFSTPLTAGCLALLKQILPSGTSSAQIRAKLKSSASQSSNPDNVYGWGVIDIASAVLDSFSVFGGVFDSASGIPLKEATITLSDLSDTCYSSESGFYFFNLLPLGQQNISIQKTGWKKQSISYTIPQYPAKKTNVNLEKLIDSSMIWGLVRTSTGKKLAGVLVSYSGPTTGTISSNLLGEFVIAPVFAGTYRIVLQKDGYKTIVSSIQTPQDTVITWVMNPILFGELAVYPVPCKSGKLLIGFLSDSLYVEESNRDFYMDLFTLDGYKVKSLKIEGISQGESVKTEMDVSTYKSGIYYIIIRFGNEKKKIKVPIIN